MSVTSILQLSRSEANQLKRHPRALLRPALELFALIAREGRVWRDIRRLAEFDDTMLRDIGIARAEIEQAVRRGRSWPVSRNDGGRGHGDMPKIANAERPVGAVRSS
jgi:uncharacterized protein YjiS (DUF1127 family)